MSNCWKRVVYLSYMEFGSRVKGAGFVKVECQRDEWTFNMHISGMAEWPDKKFEVWVMDKKGEEYGIGSIFLHRGCGEWRWGGKSGKAIDGKIFCEEIIRFTVRISEDKVIAGELHNEENRAEENKSGVGKATETEGSRWWKVGKPEFMAAEKWKREEKPSKLLSLQPLDLEKEDRRRLSGERIALAERREGRNYRGRDEEGREEGGLTEDGRGLRVEKQIGNKELGEREQERDRKFGEGKQERNRKFGEGERERDREFGEGKKEGNRGLGEEELRWDRGFGKKGEEENRRLGEEGQRGNREPERGEGGNRRPEERRQKGNRGFGEEEQEENRRLREQEERRSGKRRQEGDRELEGKEQKEKGRQGEKKRGTGIRLGGKMQGEGRGLDRAGKEIRMEEMILNDKWEQLRRMYPIVHPYEDEREYISIQPKDFVVMTGDYQHLANNSFLLHGFYNYRHIVLGKELRDEKPGNIPEDGKNKGIDRGQENVIDKKKDEINGSEGETVREDFYLGVPGVYYEREKMVALMFGFEAFECCGGKAESGKFGYYLRRVKI